MTTQAIDQRNHGGYDFELTPEDNSSPFAVNSATMRDIFPKSKTVVGAEGTGGGFSQIGHDESGLLDSEAQEFLMLEQRTASEITPRCETENVSRVSSNSIRYSNLRSSFPSQSGATRTKFSSVLKPTKTPTKSLLGRYNQNLAKNSAR